MSWDDDIALEARRRTLGSAEPRCSVAGCPEDDPRALTGVFPRILCAEHLAARGGRRLLECHHIAGRHNRAATAWLPANCHAVLTFMQQTAWPIELLRNPRADPLLRAAASIRGSHQTMAVVLTKILAPTEDELLDLHSYLSEVLGDDWPAAFAAWRESRRIDA